MTPEVLLRLANLTVARKPDRGPTVHPDPLAATEPAAEALGLTRVTASDLMPLRELHEVAVELVDALLRGRPVDEPAARLNALAHPSCAQVRLEVTGAGELRQHFVWSDPTMASELARLAVLELGEMEPARMRRCARPECDLVFYDTTRSNTRRWHAESPCGQRERQRRFRAVHGASVEDQ